jgi:hypothetical protein
LQTAVELFLRIRGDNRLLHRYATAALSSVKEALIFNLVGVGIAAGVLLVFSIPVTESFGDIILFESTGLMLVGGALGVAGQATTRKLTELVFHRRTSDSEVVSSDLKAALYILTGGLLFVEGALMAVLFY